MADDTIRNARVIPWGLLPPESYHSVYKGEVRGFVDGREIHIFSFFDDELSFDEDEINGLTRAEALELFHKKDVEYIRS